MWCTCSLSAPRRAWPWSELRSPPLHCFGSQEGPDLFPASPYKVWHALLDTACSAERVFTGHLGLEVRGQSHDPRP